MQTRFVVLQTLLVLAGSDYLYQSDMVPASQTLTLDSTRVYGVREPEGFGHQNLTCQLGTRIVITSVRFGFEKLGQIPLCGEESSVQNNCVVGLDVDHVHCQENSCMFPSLTDWSSESFSTEEKCGGGLQYWHICYDCIGAEYATEGIDDEELGDETYDYYPGQEDGYYYYYDDMYKPQVTNRFDIEGGYEDITCEHGDGIKILSVKFGYDEQSLKSEDTNNPCVFDFTHQYAEGLCSQVGCKSPTLKQLGLSSSVECGSGLGLWQIYYTCEQLGVIDTHEIQKSLNIGNQLETHVESIKSVDVDTTDVPLKSAHQSDAHNATTSEVLVSGSEVIATSLSNAEKDTFNGEIVSIHENSESKSGDNSKLDLYAHKRNLHDDDGENITDDTSTEEENETTIAENTLLVEDVSEETMQDAITTTEGKYIAGKLNSLKGIAEVDKDSKLNINDENRKFQTEENGKTLVKDNLIIKEDDDVIKQITITTTEFTYIATDLNSRKIGAEYNKEEEISLSTNPILGTSTEKSEFNELSIEDTLSTKYATVISTTSSNHEPIIFENMVSISDADSDNGNVMISEKTADEQNKGSWGWGWSFLTESKKTNVNSVIETKLKPGPQDQINEESLTNIVMPKNTKENSEFVETEGPTTIGSKSEESKVRFLHKHEQTTQEDTRIDNIEGVTTSIFDKEIMDDVTEDINEARHQEDPVNKPSVLSRTKKQDAIKIEEIKENNSFQKIKQDIESFVQSTTSSIKESYSKTSTQKNMETTNTDSGSKLKNVIILEEIGGKMVGNNVATYITETPSNEIVQTQSDRYTKKINEMSEVSLPNNITNMDDLVKTEDYQNFTVALNATTSGSQINKNRFKKIKDVDSADPSMKHETLSTTKTTKQLNPLNQLKTTRTNVIEKGHGSTTGRKKEQTDGISIARNENLKENINMNTYAKLGSDNVTLEYADEELENVNIEPYLMFEQFTDLDLPKTSTEISLEQNNKSGTNFYTDQIDTKSSINNVPSQQTTSDLIILENPSNVDINHSGAIETHKYIEIDVSEHENKHHESVHKNEEETNDFTRYENLVKPKANFQGGDKSVVKDQSAERSNTSSSVITNLPETNSHGTKSFTNKMHAIKSSSDQSSENNATVIGLKSSQGNRKTEHILIESETISTIVPSNSSKKFEETTEHEISNDNRTDVKSENINHHIVNYLTMDITNNSRIHFSSLNSDIVHENKSEEYIGIETANLKDKLFIEDQIIDHAEEFYKRNMKVSRFATANKVLFSSTNKSESSLINDSFLDETKNESHKNIGLEGNISKDSSRGDSNPESGKTHRREKLLLEKGHFKIPSTKAKVTTATTSTTKLETIPTRTAPQTDPSSTQTITITTTTTSIITKIMAPITTTTTITITTITTTPTSTTTTNPITTTITTPISTTAKTNNRIRTTLLRKSQTTTSITAPPPTASTTTFTSTSTVESTKKPKMTTTPRTYIVEEAITSEGVHFDSYSDTVHEYESIPEDEYLDDNVVEPVSESTIEEEIEEEISQGIDQLKSELKMLLVFNDNILNASNEIVKEATKAKVEHFFESVSSSLNMMNIQKKIHKNDKTTSRKKATKKREDINTATSILNITADISKTLASTVEIGSQVDIKLPNISMTVMKKKMGTTNSSVWEADSLKVNLPDQLTIAGADSSITVSFTSYENLGSMMSMNDDFSSSVLSVNVLGVEKIGNTIPLTKPIEFILKHKPMTDFSDRKCVYWDFEETGWSQKGCYAVAEMSTDTTTMCKCRHLTNFAVLIDVYGLAQSEQHKNNLDILTWIGCGISIVSLVVCIYVFSTFRSAKNDRSAINSNLCFCLLLAELFFLCGIGQTGYPSLCSVIAAVLHYLFLASFFWMLIAGFQIYVLLVEVFEPDGSRFVQYYLLGYIAPLLIVLCSLLMDTLLNYETVYGYRDFCWINSNIHLVLSFLMPVFLIVGANLYFLSVAVYKIHLHSRDSLIVHKSKTASLKMYVKGLFGLLFLLGVTWGFGIISVTHPSLTFTYIFTILNSLHGFFIFMFNCVMNKKIRNEGRRKIEELLSCMVQSRRRHTLLRKESTLSNSSAMSQTNSTTVKEYFLPDMPYTIDPADKKSKQKNALSITYYY